MSRYLVSIVMGLSVAVAGCGKQEPPKVTGKEVEEKYAQAASATADYARQERDEYVARTQKAVDGARAKIDELKARAGKAPPAARRKLRRQIAAMESRWKLAQRKLGELKAATGEAWRDLRSGVDRAVEDLKKPGSSRSS